MNHRENLTPVVDAAQRVAGVLAARGRGDTDGAHALMSSFDTEHEMLGGALLVAELSLGLLREQTGETLDECVHELTVALERAVH